MIKLQNGLKICHDGGQYTLNRSALSKRKDTGEEYESDRILGYYGTLSDALKGYCRRCIAEHIQFNDMELREVKVKVDELKKEISAYE